MIDHCLNRLHVKRGSDLPQAKLTESDVTFIRSLFERREELKKELATLTNGEIAKVFNVHKRTIDRISAGENWTHV